MVSKKNYPDQNDCTIAIIGLGYVGLPLAIEFSKKQKCNISGKILRRKVIGFDINTERLKNLKNGFDITNEIGKGELLNANFADLLKNNNIKFSDYVGNLIYASFVC